MTRSRCGRVLGQAGGNAPPDGAPAVNAPVTGIRNAHRVAFIVRVGVAGVRFLIRNIDRDMNLLTSYTFECKQEKFICLHFLSHGHGFIALAGHNLYSKVIEISCKVG